MLISAKLIYRCKVTILATITKDKKEKTIKQQ
jgi:hypothetical protein